MHDTIDKSNQVQYTVEWQINEGALEKVKQHIASSTELVKTNEPKMMAFHWYLNEDQSKFYLIEWFADADAIVDHFANVGEALQELFNYAQITRFEVFGNLTEKAQAAVDHLGAKTLGHWHGFTRTP